MNQVKEIRIALDGFCFVLKAVRKRHNDQVTWEYSAYLPVGDIDDDDDAFWIMRSLGYDMARERLIDFITDISHAVKVLDWIREVEG